MLLKCPACPAKPLLLTLLVFVTDLLRSTIESVTCLGPILHIQCSDYVVTRLQWITLRPYIPSLENIIWSTIKWSRFRENSMRTHCHGEEPTVSLTASLLRRTFPAVPSLSRASQCNRRRVSYRAEGITRVRSAIGGVSMRLAAPLMRSAFAEEAPKRNESKSSPTAKQRGMISGAGPRARGRGTRGARGRSRGRGRGRGRSRGRGHSRSRSRSRHHEQTKRSSKIRGRRRASPARFSSSPSSSSPSQGEEKRDTYNRRGSQDRRSRYVADRNRCGSDKIQSFQSSESDSYLSDGGNGGVATSSTRRHPRQAFGIDRSSPRRSKSRERSSSLPLEGRRGDSFHRPAPDVGYRRRHDKQVLSGSVESRSRRPGRQAWVEDGRESRDKEHGGIRNSGSRRRKNKIHFRHRRCARGRRNRRRDEEEKKSYEPRRSSYSKSCSSSANSTSSSCFSSGTSNSSSDE